MKKALKSLIGLWLVLFFVCVASASAQRAKNVILLIGDGMGPNHVQAARLMKAYKNGAPLAMDQLDSVPSLVNTLNYQGKVTDSAAGATALATGYKTSNGHVSWSFDDAPAPAGELYSVFQRAEELGKATGIVTNVYLQDATPGVWAAKWPSRNGREIALQQAEATYAEVEVLLGSGRYYMLPKGKLGGSRTDGRNLIKEMVDKGYLYVDTVDKLNAVDAEAMQGHIGLLGVFGSIWAIEYVLDRDPDLQHSPSLPEMAAKAIDVLKANTEGFFLVIEGGAIDWTATSRDIAGVIAETLEFDECVQLALDFAKSKEDTLVVVTADHETGALELGDVDLDFLDGITRTTEFMWGLIHKGKMPIADVMETYAGITDLTPFEEQLIKDYGEGGMADVLSARAGVTWGWSGSDDGNHTDRDVQVYAFGPGADTFNGGLNTDTGISLFIAVSGYWQ
jgi:alkaline phosphatase